VPRAYIIGFVESSNTIEDAVFTERVLRLQSYDRLYVITSDFHVERAELLFRHVLPQSLMTFISAPTSVGQALLTKLQLHERDSLSVIQEAGLARVLGGLL